jgi:hypothetical protein
LTVVCSVDLELLAGVFFNLREEEEDEADFGGVREFLGG